MNVKPMKAVKTEEVNPTCYKCQQDPEKKPDCPTCPHRALRDIPEVLNYSATKRAALKFLGPTARVWHKGSIEVGFDTYPGRHILAKGETFQEALEVAIAAHRTKETANAGV